ncbi:ROK family transcriptional regulator [Phycicoccus sp. BSK3Z-2]|uniref:ROK family transcriptional regulator n=1 Tax=Phycicoccus avicenniae TaxID=2828860 RepID=A0A941DAS5_9MICO|nr:ROK family transcriptional regulator [Phycicoccus avicenniae]MBR7744676.1 ROK family transcriptional regulator [Phycicoccus avicenniae]
MLRTLRSGGAMSRGQIANAVGLSRTTLSEIAGDLLRRGAIVVVDTDAERRTGSGRPAERLALDPRSGQFLGVDFGHRRVQVAVADASHEIVAVGASEYPESCPWTERVQRAFGLADDLAAEHDLHFGALQGVGIGVTGPLSAEAPHTTAAPSFREAAVDLAFERRFGTRVLVDNNSRLAGLAEALLGVPPDAQVEDLVFVRLSDGVGGAVVVGGRLVAGRHGLSGELGHVTVDPDGASCRCGKTGCLETVASARAVLTATARRGLDLPDLEAYGAAVDDGEPAALAVAREVGTAVGRVLGTVAMAVDPAEVVIGGSVARVAPPLVAEAARVVATTAFPGSEPPRVRLATLSDDDGALGALAALFHSSPLLENYPQQPRTVTGSAGSPRPPVTTGGTHVGVH